MKLLRTLILLSLLAACGANKAEVVLPVPVQKELEISPAQNVQRVSVSGPGTLIVVQDKEILLEMKLGSDTAPREVSVPVGDLRKNDKDEMYVVLLDEPSPPPPSTLEAPSPPPTWFCPRSDPKCSLCIRCMPCCPLGPQPTPCGGPRPRPGDRPPPLPGDQPPRPER
jgi:hypothetical protein